MMHNPEMHTPPKQTRPIHTPFQSRGIRRSLLMLILVGTIFATTPQPAAAEPVFASRSSIRKYWEGFKEYWSGAVRNQSGITMIVLATGAVGIFIISRVKGNR